MTQTIDEFKREVCLLLGVFPSDIGEQAWHYHYQWNNPRWAAVCIKRELLGPGGLEQAKQFARQLGFNE